MKGRKAESGWHLATTWPSNLGRSTAINVASNTISKLEGQVLAEYALLSRNLDQVSSRLSLSLKQRRTAALIAEAEQLGLRSSFLTVPIQLLQISIVVQRLSAVQPHLLNQVRPLERKLGLVLTLFKGTARRPSASNYISYLLPCFHCSAHLPTSCSLTSNTRLSLSLQRPFGLSFASEKTRRIKRWKEVTTRKSVEAAMCYRIESSFVVISTWRRAASPNERAHYLQSKPSNALRHSSNTASSAPHDYTTIHSRGANLRDVLSADSPFESPHAGDRVLVQREQLRTRRSKPRSRHRRSDRSSSYAPRISRTEAIEGLRVVETTDCSSGATGACALALLEVVERADLRPALVDAAFEEDGLAVVSRGDEGVLRDEDERDGGEGGQLDGVDGMRGSLGSRRVDDSDGRVVACSKLQSAQAHRSKARRKAHWRKQEHLRWARRRRREPILPRGWQTLRRRC